MYKDEIKKKAFWFTKVKVRQGKHWPFGTQKYIEDLSRVIPDNFYGDNFAAARLSTNDDFAQAFGDPTLLARLADGSIGLEDRASFSLIAHGYNSNAILGKLRNSEISQAVFKPKAESNPQLATPILDHKAELAHNEPGVTVADFMRLLRAERYAKYPEILAQNRRAASIDTSLGFMTPLLENNVNLRVTEPAIALDNDDATFAAVIQNISDKVGIDILPDSSLDEKEISLTAKRFFGGLDTIKRVVSRKNAGIQETGWPKRYNLYYPEANTNTEKLYAVIKCLSGVQVSRLADLSRDTIVKNPSATNLPSAETFDYDRNRLVSATACLVASDMCHMMGIPAEQARMLSDTFKFEAYENFLMMAHKDNANFMPLVADYHAIAINNFAIDFQVKMDDYARSRNVSSDQVLNFGGLLYANDVARTGGLEYDSAADNDRLTRGLEQLLDLGRSPKPAPEPAPEPRPAPYRDETPVPSPTPEPKPAEPESTEPGVPAEEEDLDMEEILTNFFNQEAFNTQYRDPSADAGDSHDNEDEDARDTDAERIGGGEQGAEDEDTADAERIGGDEQNADEATDTADAERGRRGTPKQRPDFTPLTDEEQAEAIRAFFSNPAFDQQFAEEAEREMLPSGDMGAAEVEADATSDAEYELSPSGGDEAAADTADATDNISPEDERMLRDIFSRYFNQDEYKTTYKESVLTDAERQAAFAPFFNQDEYKTAYQTTEMTDSDRERAFAPFFNQDEYKTQYQEKELTDSDRQAAFAPFFNQNEYKTEYSEPKLSDNEKRAAYAPFFNQPEFKQELPADPVVSDAELAESLKKFFEDEKANDRERQARQTNLGDFGAEVADKLDEKAADKAAAATTDKTADETAEQAKANGNTGAEAKGAERTANDPKPAQEAKKAITKPILKVTEPQRLSPADLPEGKLPKYRTNAGRECREFLYEIVMEYSMEHLKATADCAKMQKSVKDPMLKSDLREQESVNKGKSSVGSVAGAIMYSLAKNKSLSTDYNAKNFPQESQAVHDIDKLTHHIISEVKEFAGQNPEVIKGDNVSVKKINQYFETLGGTALVGAPKATRAQKIEKGRELLKMSLRDAVYGILDGVTPPNGLEDAEAMRLREEAQDRLAPEDRQDAADAAEEKGEADEAKESANKDAQERM